MKMLFLALALIASCTPALANVSVPINKQATMLALIDCTRAPRSWKTAWLVPGAVTSWSYQWILEDGSTITKIEPKRIKGVPDRRPLHESHPDVAIVMPLVGPALQGLWLLKR